MTETEQLADIIALSVHAAVQPLLLKIAVLEARIATDASRDVSAPFVDALTDLRARVGGLESRAAVPGPQGATGEPGRPGADGRDGAPGLDGKDGRNGLDGKDGSPGLNGKDGRDGLDGKDGADGLAGKDGRTGVDGKDGAPGVAGKDGQDGLDGKSGSAGLDGKSGQDGLHGKDGIGLSGALVDRDGHLVVTFSDGSTKDVGPVVGKDGAPGLHGKDGASGLDGKDGSPGRDGLNGKDGHDGLSGKDGAPGSDGVGFDDLDVTFDDRLGWQLLFARGAEQKSFPLPIPFDAGIWEVGRVYPKGAGVTVKGAFWIALRQTSSRPGGDDVGARDWRLAVKGGKDGRPGKDGRDGMDA